MYYEDRTVRQWLTDPDGEIVEATPEDLAELDRVLGHDEFWQWASGRVAFRKESTPRWAWLALIIFVGFLIISTIL